MATVDVPQPVSDTDSAIAAHEAATDPHTGYQLETEKGAASGYASLDADTLVPIAELPTGVTSSTVSLGDHGHAPAMPQINPQTGTTFTPAAGDIDGIVTLDNVGAIIVTLPQDSDVVFAVGGHITFYVINTGLATFAAGTGADVNGTPSLVSRAQWSKVTATKRAANTWILSDDLA